MKVLLIHPMNMNIYHQAVPDLGLGYLAEEVNFLYSKFNIREIGFVDDNFSTARATLEEFCRRKIRDGPNIKWTCMGIRIDLLDESILTLMEKSGCYLIYVGIESGSQRILDHMQKCLTIEKLERN